MLKKIMTVFLALALVAHVQAADTEDVNAQGLNETVVETILNTSELNENDVQAILELVKRVQEVSNESAPSSKKKTFFQQYKSAILAACFLVPVVAAGGTVVAARQGWLPKAVADRLPEWEFLQKQSKFERKMNNKDKNSKSGKKNTGSNDDSSGFFSFFDGESEEGFSGYSQDTFKAQSRGFCDSYNNNNNFSFSDGNTSD